MCACATETKAVQVLTFFFVHFTPKQRAIRLDPSDPLTTILFQVTGPAHIPWQDQRWQELLHGYNVWVHVEHHPSGVLDRACQSLLLHATRSSNLAALVMHVTRMLRALFPPEMQALSIAAAATSTVDGVTTFSNRIALVGKARATAGSLNLLRILVHSVISSSNSLQYQPDAFLKDCFRYRNRDSNHEQDVAADLVEALLYFVQQCHHNMAGGGSTANTFPPEVYDTLALVLQLLLVLLSTQLYRPMQSSFQRAGVQRDYDINDTKLQSQGYFWEILLHQADRQAHMVRTDHTMKPSWTPAGVLSAFMEWTMTRPDTPARSIQQHACALAAQVVAAKGEKRQADGMYENYLVVTACSVSKPVLESNNRGNNGTSTDLTVRHRHTTTAAALLDATKGVLVLSSSIIMLPFRLMSLALGLWNSSSNNKGYDQVHKKQLQSSLQHQSRTKDVLWLTESPVADLSSCLFLLLINNERAGNNPFRDEIAGLTDNRWEATDGGILQGLPDLPQRSEDETAPLMTLEPPQVISKERALSVNFEALFGTFGSTAHSEVGALLLYSIIQASPGFAEAIGVRSDLDTIVLPLLRTLYFASSSRFYAAHDYSSQNRSSDSASSKRLSIRNCPFRSPSQLYVLVILLLLFSQDSSFGADAFRRVVVHNVPWYKERNLKTISLGSIIVLSVLRSLTFNLNRLEDPFLLNNCCAVLLNISPSIVELHEYTAMRLMAVTVTCMKRYMELVQQHPDDDEEELSTPTAMHGEATRSLLLVITHCLSTTSLDRNLHLIYALVYHQSEFKKITSANGTLLGEYDHTRKESPKNDALTFHSVPF
jgi:hypothetical protein